MPAANRRQRTTGQPAAAKPASQALRVRTRSGQPRRRAGLQFGPQWRDLAPDELTPAQRDEILADATLQAEPRPAAPALRADPHSEAQD